MKRRRASMRACRWAWMLIGAAVFIPAGMARAQHAGDIYLEQAGGRIATGLVDDETGKIQRGVRVFGAELEELFTNEPGFDTAEGAFAPGSSIGFNIRRALRAWDGAAQGFAGIPVERIEVRLGPLGPVISPAGDLLTTGFSIAVSPDGRWHHHLGYTLLSPAAAGIYLLELELWSSEGSVGASEPFWIVFNHGDSEDQHAAAIAWAQEHLVACAVDLNRDGVVDFADYLEFLNRYEEQDLSVDFNGDGVVDFADYLEFLNRYEAGCA